MADVAAPPDLFVLSAGAMPAARQITAALPGARVIGPADRVPEADLLVADIGVALSDAFAANTPIVGFCAAGILIRQLASLLDDKRAEPPVIAVSADGATVVPLLGGHHGANRLARRLADLLGGTAAVTTASDTRFDIALDDPPPGWTLANPEHSKPFTMALLDGAAVRLQGEADWIEASDLPLSADGALTIISDVHRAAGGTDRLVYHPQRLAVGVGCERDTPPDALIAHVRDTLAEAGLAEAAVAGLFSIDLKADEPAVHAVGAALNRPVRFFDAEELEAQAGRLANPSETVFRAVGCHGVAEGAALAAVGADGELIVPKRISSGSTCAIALSSGPMTLAEAGRPRGCVMVVGLGPGPAAWRTPEATAALATATDLVGYRAYFDLIDAREARAQQHPFALGEEVSRARHALDLAAEGRSVALVSSGDAGIYAMASVLFELLDHAPAESAWRRIEVSVQPGLSAMQAAAARVGAPLGHDFCAISLSDLLTPWPVIERRLRAAAAGDFVVALYNPVSTRRRWQLARACEILGEGRPPETVVALARNLGRAQESVTLTRLCDISDHMIDMLTVIIIGSSASRRLDLSGGRAAMYTPRGYDPEADESGAQG